MSKQIKKALARVTALVMVVLLTTGAVSVMGTDNPDYQYDNSNIYISTEPDTGDDDAVATPGDDSDDGYNTGDDSTYGDNDADADYGNDSDTDSDIDNDADSEYNDTDYGDDDYYYTEEDEYDEDEEDEEEYDLLGILAPIIPIMPLSSIIIDGTESFPFTVAAGVTATIVDDITGEIIVDGGILILEDDFTTTGTVTVQNGGTFTMEDGTITGTGTRGVTVNGAGSTFNMSGGVIEGNSVTSGSGGGVAVNNGATFEISGSSVIRGNNAQGNGGGVSVVGVGSTFTMRDGTIQGNSITTPASSMGGGVAVSGGATATMYDGLITDNTSARHGGGVAVFGSSVFNMNGGLIYDNLADSGGGGVHAQGTAQFIMRNNATVDYNSAGVHGSSGGGFYLAANSSLTIYNGVISNNISASVGGGMTLIGSSTLIMHNGRVYNNESTSHGGGINGGGSNVTITIHGGNVYSNESINGRGGGVRIDTSASFIMTGGTIEDNTAATTGGGVVIENGASFNMSGTSLIFDNNASRNGGGVIVTSPGSTFIMLGGTIENNTATQNGGGVAVQSGANFTMSGTALVYDNTANAEGGGVNVEGAGTTFIMNDGSIVNNHATTISGGGGGVHVSAGATFNMTNGIIERNHIGVIRSSAASATGGRAGGVLISGTNSVFNFSGGSIRYNEAHGNGGVRVASGATFNMSEPNSSHPAQIYSNTAAFNGGIGIYHTSVATMSGGTIRDNISLNGHAGGLLIGNTVSFTITGGVIENNIASDDGDVIPQYPLHVGLGGGVWVNHSATLIVHDGFITNNHAARYGGGIFATRYEGLDIANSVTFSGNTANAPHNHGEVNRGSDNLVDAAYSGDTGLGGSIANINWATVSIPNTHALNNFDINYTGTPLFELEVIVRDESGNPITDAEVVIRNEDGDIIFTGTTDEDGRVSIFVPNGEYEIIASHTDYDTVQPVDVTVDGDDETVIIVLPTSLHTVTFLPGATGVTGMPSNRTVANGTAVSSAGGAVATPSRDGYTFLGWLQTIPTATGNISSANVGSIVVTQDMTFVAQWQPNNDNGGGNGTDPTPNPAVQITKSAPSTVQPNATLTYTITVRNTGNVTLSNLAVSDILPEALQNPRNLQFPAGVTASFTGQTLNATIATLNPGQSVTITFDVTVNAEVGEAITNTASVLVSEQQLSRQDSTTTTVTHQPPQLIKAPSNEYVNIGDHINWALRNIHNYTGETVSDFSIVDMPSRGLNFVSGNLPAFTNGAGITFDIRYTVAGSNEWHTYATGVDASQPFSFSLPQPGNIHYTNIGFFFGTVPANFADGNEIVLTFLVTDESPTNVLVNRFALRYRNVERQGQGEVIIQRPDGTPPTGGGNNGGNDSGSVTDITPLTPLADREYQTIYEEETPVVYGYIEESTTDTTTDTTGTTDTTDTSIGRTNPQTGDNFDPTGIILSMFGIVASLGVILLVLKPKRKTQHK